MCYHFTNCCYLILNKSVRKVLLEIPIDRALTGYDKFSGSSVSVMGNWQGGMCL